MASLAAIELTGTIDERNELRLDSAIPLSGPRRVRVILLYAADEDIDESEWLRAATHNPAFAFLNEAEEDIYSLSDGKPLDDKG